MRRLLALAVLVAWPSSGRADVTLTIDTGPGAQFAQQAGIDLQSLTGQLKTELDKIFQTYRVKDYLRSFGDAQAFTTRGLGVDYASDLKFVMVGVAANVSINTDKAFVPTDLKSRPAVEGLSTSITFMAGLNL